MATEPAVLVNYINLSYDGISDIEVFIIPFRSLFPKQRLPRKCDIRTLRNQSLPDEDTYMGFNNEPLFQLYVKLYELMGDSPLGPNEFIHDAVSALGGIVLDESKHVTNFWISRVVQLTRYES